MKQLRSFLIILALGALVLAGLACSDSGDTNDETAGYTERDSRDIARDYLLQDPTFLFDGIEGSVELVETITLRCPECWTFVFDFECRQAGYGDRTGQMLAQVITPHTARITVVQGQVTDATLDDKWDMMTQTMLETPPSPGPGLVISCDDFQNTAHITRDITLAIGNTIEIRLCENPTTGFSWQEPALSDSAVLAITDNRYLEPLMSDEPQVGAAGTRILIIEARQAGSSTLTMDYSRPWEGGEKGNWTFTLNVTVPGADELAGLLDREWLLVSYGPDNDPLSVIEGTRITATFTLEDDGSISFGGTGGCNHYFGSLRFTEDGIESGPVGSTEMWCGSEGVMDQEGAFLGAMSQIQGFEVDGDTLEITCEGDLLVFTTE